MSSLPSTIPYSLNTVYGETFYIIELFSVSHSDIITISNPAEHVYYRSNSGLALVKKTAIPKCKYYGREKD